MVLGLCLYTLVLDFLGFIMATMILSMILLGVLGMRSWRSLLLTSLATSILCYVLFDRLLGVELPAGILAAFQEMVYGFLGKP